LVKRKGGDSKKISGNQQKSALAGLEQRGRPTKSKKKKKSKNKRKRRAVEPPKKDEGI